MREHVFERFMWNSRFWSAEMYTHTLPHTAGYLANYAGQTPRMANPYPPGLFYRSS